MRLHPARYKPLFPSPSSITPRSFELPPDDRKPNLNRLVNGLIDNHFPYLRGEHVHAIHAPFDMMQSPFGVYHGLRDDFEFEYIIMADLDLVPSRSLLRAGLTHELAHVALDAGRPLDVLSSINASYDHDPDVHYEEEILANALCIEAGAGSGMWRLAYWARDRFGSIAPLENMRAAQRWLR